jgi:hypothetical protein
MKKLSTLLFILIAVILLNSCAKTASIDIATAITYQAVAGTYKLTAMTAQDYSTGGQVDLYAQMSACQKDDQEILSADGTYYHVDAGTQCNPPGSITSNWSLNVNKITIASTSGDIHSYDGKTLVVTSTQTNNGTAYLVTQTFVRQ